MVCASDTLAIGAAKYPAGAGSHRHPGERPWQQSHADFLLCQHLSLDFGCKDAGILAARQLLDQIEEGSPQSNHRPCQPVVYLFFSSIPGVLRFL